MGPKARAAEAREKAEADRERKLAEAKEKEEAADWSVGARNDSRSKLAEEKEAEKLRKQRELAEIMQQEDAELSSVKQQKKTKKKGKDDFDLLNAALASAPKTKAQKDAELKKKQQEEQKLKEDAAREAKEARLKAQEDEIQAALKKGIVMNHTDALFVPINNRLPEDLAPGEDGDWEGEGEGFLHASGLDSAIGALAVDDKREKKMKALYNAYYSVQLPLIKEELPGLKLSQYKERIFDRWQVSPENPRNQK